MTRGRTLLMSFSGFSMKFVGKEKPNIHYPVSSNQEKTKSTLACISSSYPLFILPCLCISKIFTPSAIPGNGTRNACWHFLTFLLGGVMSDCYSGQSTRGVPGGRVSGWGSQDQELDGNTKTQGLRQVRAAMSITPYVLCSGLY